MYNMYGFSENYDECLLGKSKITFVKNLDKITPKRAGVVVYYEQEVEPQFPIIKNLPKLEITPRLPKKTEYGAFKILKRESSEIDISDEKINPSHQIITNPKPNLVTIEEKSEQMNNYPNDVINNVIVKSPKNKTKRIFGFGIDSKFGTLTDFGGGIKYKIDGNPVSAALRELKEESLGLFDFDKESIQDCCCIYNNQILIIFIPIILNPAVTNLFFNSLLSNAVNPEVSKLVWVNEKELIQKLKRPYVIFEPVRSLINQTFVEVIKYI